MSLINPRRETQHRYEHFFSPKLDGTLGFNNPKSETLEEIMGAEQNTPNMKSGKVEQAFTPHVTTGASNNKKAMIPNTPSVSNDAEWYDWLSNNNVVDMFPEEYVPNVVKVLKTFATTLYTEVLQKKKKKKKGRRKFPEQTNKQTNNNNKIKKLERLQQENTEVTRRWKETNEMKRYYETMENEYAKLQKDYMSLLDHCKELQKSQTRVFERSDKEKKWSDHTTTTKTMRTRTRAKNGGDLMLSPDHFDSLSDPSPAEALLLQDTPLNKDLCSKHDDNNSSSSSSTATTTTTTMNDHNITHKLNEIAANLQRLLDREHEMNQCMEQLKLYQAQISEISSLLLLSSSAKWKEGGDEEEEEKKKKKKKKEKTRNDGFFGWQKQSQQWKLQDESEFDKANEMKGLNRPNGLMTMNKDTEGGNESLLRLEKHLQMIEQKQDLQKASIDDCFHGFRDMVEQQLKDILSLSKPHSIHANFGHGHYKVAGISANASAHANANANANANTNTNTNTNININTNANTTMNAGTGDGSSRLQKSLELNGSGSFLWLGPSDEEKEDNHSKPQEHKSDAVGALLQLSPIVPNKKQGFVAKKIQFDKPTCDCNSIVNQVCSSILTQSSQMSNEMFEQIFPVILSVVIALGSPQHYMCKSDKLHNKIHKFVLRLNEEMNVYVNKWIKNLLKRVTTDIQRTQDRQQHISSALKDIATLCDKKEDDNDPKLVVDETKIAQEIKTKVVLKDIWILWICTLFSGLLVGFFACFVISSAKECKAEFI
ncbi:outer membrane protein [Reticulomyxa filosa]|uniref:Outer membrane protein n=1 Tax=Reticulomyxa filosa TaxID=46433 RepID=X6MB30_RETFI|nr:outer membrane protein [Reticulomyxa filosa]|eukprot:ETO10240.1 outer membrane protein [Reticulomyxa filosa]